jgi:hypothetical protein
MPPHIKGSGSLSVRDLPHQAGQRKRSCVCTPTLAGPPNLIARSFPKPRGAHHDQRGRRGDPPSYIFVGHVIWTCLAAQRKRYEYQAALEPMTRNGIGYEHELGGHRRRWPCAARYTDPFLPAEIDWCVAPRSTTAGRPPTITAVTPSGAGSQPTCGGPGPSG